MMPGLPPPALVAQARARLLAEDGSAARLRTELRALWDAAERLSSAGPADAARLPRLTLHRAAIERVVEAWAPQGPAAERLGALPPGRRYLLGDDGVRVLSGSGPGGDGAAEADRAAAVHARLLAHFEHDLRVVQQWRKARRVGAGLALVAAGALAVVGWRLAALAVEPEDLASGKTFNFSSEWAPCDPERGRCGGHPTRIFFHTREEDSPWAQVDLGAPTTFSRVMVRNRSDMALMKAVPLLIELSDDGQAFRQVARQDERFETWTARFEPTSARYVRVRVPRRTYLHLEAVKVWR